MENYFKNQEIEEAAYKRSICTNFVYMYIYKRESELFILNVGSVVKKKIIQLRGWKIISDKKILKPLKFSHFPSS